jgi:maltose/moltooligosaccharide transporter
VFTSKEYPPEDMAAWEEGKRSFQRHDARVYRNCKGIGTMPKTMLQLAVVQFFTWLAFFSMWIYTSSA